MQITFSLFDSNNQPLESLIRNIPNGIANPTDVLLYKSTIWVYLGLKAPSTLLYKKASILQIS